MSRQETEQERLKRIRDQQISARDPSVKERKVSKRISAQQVKKSKSESFFRDAMGNVSNKVKGIYIGALLGLVVMFLLPQFLEPRIANILGIMSIPLLIILGVLIGASFDWRDEIRDDMR
jgi:hypothetical protein